jgi:hypothetical protein
MSKANAFECLLGTLFTATMVVFLFLGSTRNSMPFVLLILAIVAIHLIAFRLMLHEMIFKARTIEKKSLQSLISSSRLIIITVNICLLESFDGNQKN